MARSQPQSQAVLADTARPPHEHKDKAHLRPCPPRIPEALDPPPNATLEQALEADGVQIYACAAGKGGEPPAWALEAPHAVLRTGPRVQGVHFAGPTWQALDGSQLRGAKLAAADAPDAAAVPWLLLSATPTGDGTFAHVTHIQRLETVGGKAPALGCDAGHLGAKVLVPYRSSYFFYRSAAPGVPVHQCNSGRKKPGSS